MTDYLLSYDVAAAAEMFPQLSSFVKGHKLIDQWSQPYNGLYLLKSPSDLLTLTHTFDEFFARRVFHVLVPITTPWIGGILPANIWEWLRAPPATTANLLEFLQSKPQS
jgi:hypothetical protein